VLAAVGIATASAQVYSVNVVGYVSKDLAAGFSIIANPLSTGDNTLNDVVAGVPVGTTIFKFNNASGAFDSSVYFGEAAGWTPNLSFGPGEAGFVQLSAPQSIVFTGEVLNMSFDASGNPTGQTVNSLPAGFSIVGSMTPQDGLGSAFPADIGDTIYVYNTTTQAYDSSVYFGPGVGFTPAPDIKVGDGFWVQKANPGDWVRDYAATP
jgi:hypothetical protein